MSKRRLTRKRHKRKPGRSSDQRTRDKVEKLTAQGLNRELVVAKAGISFSKLRTDFAEELDAGRTERATRAAEQTNVTREEYH